MSNQSTYVRIASGSFGSRNGQPWSHELAKANDRTKPSDLAAGTFGAVDRIEPHIVKRAIEAQMCPWCGAGPFKVLAAHTNKAHGVDRAELRRLAGLPQNSSICDPGYADDRRSDWMQRPDRESITRKANAASVSAGAYQAAAASLAQKMAVENRVRDSEIMQAVSSGEFRQDIAERFGVAPATVSRIVRRHAQATDAARVDGRKHAATLRWDASKQVALREGWARAAEEIRIARVRRFAELGGTWAALDVMATEENTTRRKMAAILRHAGVAVPDGRSVTPHRRKPGSLPPKPKKPCSEEGCDRDSSTRGMCRLHYQRWSRTKV